MYYVSKVVSYFGSYYGDMGINTANSTGASDVIVVEQPDGTLKSTPFHVRFGKLNLIRPKEVIIDVIVNNDYVKEVEMRVEPTGQAYFEMQKRDRNSSENSENSNSNVLKSTSCDPQSSKVRIRRVHTKSTNNMPLYDVDNSLSPGVSKGSDSQLPVLRLHKTTENYDNGYPSSDDSSSGVNSDKSEIFPSVKMSLCGSLTTLNYSNSSSRECFYKSMVAYEDFYQNPSNVLNCPNLVVLYNKEFMDWTTFSVIAISKLAFQKNLSTMTAQSIMKTKRETSKAAGYSGWFLWRSSAAKSSSSTSSDGKSDDTTKPLSSTSHSTPPHTPNSTEKTFSTNSAIEMSTEDKDAKPNAKVHHKMTHARTRSLSGGDMLDREAQAVEDFVENTSIEMEASCTDQDDANADSETCVESSEEVKSYSMDDSALHNPTGYIKSHTLPSDTLKLLKLKQGVNEISYVVTGKYRGTIKVGCKIYFWKSTDKIIISDIDGTITKSDVMGHLGPMIGLDWTQSGVVQLYNGINRNGYKFVYLSARSIGHADVTRNYLASVKQDQSQLPDGPVLLAPGSFFTAFKKEIIERHPEEIKINTLSELKALFPESNKESLYAGFGNRPSDIMTYEAVSIPSERIFTVNKHGEVNYNQAIQSEDVSAFSTSYTKLSESIDEKFPAMSADEHTIVNYFV